MVNQNYRVIYLIGLYFHYFYLYIFFDDYKHEFFCNTSPNNDKCDKPEYKRVRFACPLSAIFSKKNWILEKVEFGERKKRTFIGRTDGSLSILCDLVVILLFAGRYRRSRSCQCNFLRFADQLFWTWGFLRGRWEKKRSNYTIYDCEKSIRTC